MFYKFLFTTCVCDTLCSFSLFTVTNIYSIQKRTKKQKFRNEIESDTEDSTLEELVCSKDKQIDEVNKIV